MTPLLGRAARAIALLMTLPLILGGCATLQTLSAGRTEPRVDVTAVACEAFGPITWADGDTDATIAQIRQHNAAWVEVCADAPRI